MASDRTCSIEGCEKPYRARGWCSMHWKRWRKHGDPLMLAQGPTPEARFWEKVDVADVADACWLWTAGQTRGGYGHMRVGDKIVYAHRFSYELLVGPIPAGLELDHLCRVRRCANPDHLEPVSSAENTRRSDLVGAHWADKRAARTHCPHGHPASEYSRRLSGRYACRACARERWRLRHQHQKPAIEARP